MSRHLLRRGLFTDRVVLLFGEIEGIIGDNLPFGAIRDAEWWANNRGTSQGRAWIDVGWRVQDVDLNKRTATFIKVAQPEIKQKKKTKEKKKTPFFQQPLLLRYRRHKRPTLPSKTKIAQAQARLRNVERQKMTSQIQRGKVPPRSAHEKRLFKPEAKPSKTPA
jgi:hypothetical protein